MPDDVFTAYREITPIDSGFDHRRELWLVFAYLAVVTVDDQSSFGRQFLTRLPGAVQRYK